MNKSLRWIVLIWTLGIGCAALVILFAAPGVGLAGPPPPKSLGLISSQSPILGNWANYRSDSVDNRAPAVAYNSVRDEYLVVWEDHNASEIAIYGRRVSSAGAPLDSAIQIAHYGAYTSCQPSVAYSPVQDKYLVVYAQDSKPSLPPYSDYNIIGQPVNGDGTKTESAFLIGGNSNHQNQPVVTYNSVYDEFLVVWHEEQGAGGWYDIWAQRRNAADLPADPGSVCIATGDSLHRHQPDVAYNAARNDYLIAYTWGSSGGIFGKVVDAGLTNPLSITEIQIIVNSNLQDDVALAAGPDEYLAVWQDGPSCSWRTIYGRRVTGVGTTPEPAFLVDEHVNRVCAGPDVAYGRGLGYLVIWTYDDPTSAEDTYGRYVTPGATMHALDTFAIDVYADSQIDPAVACTRFGDCLLVESDNWSNADYEINGRTVKPHHLFLPLAVSD